MKLFNNDCFDILPQLPSESIDMILCDLPYGVLNKSNPSAKWDSVLPLNRLWEQYNHIIKSNGAIVLFGQGMFSAQLMLSNKKYWRYNLIWHKSDRPTGFLNAKRMPLRSHEDILIFYKSLPTYNPQMEYAGPHKRNHSRGKQEKEQTNRCYGQFGKADDIISDYKYPKSIISIPREEITFHPTQKPVALCEYLIRTYSNEGDTILDNCMGSGTTGVACINTSRHFIGIEKDTDYFNKAKERIESVSRSSQSSQDSGE